MILRAGFLTRRMCDSRAVSCRLPGINQWQLAETSSLTVAGAVADSHRFPYSSGGQAIRRNASNFASPLFTGHPYD